MNDQIHINQQLYASLTATRYIIGRSEQCDILLPESDAGVSRRHATLQRDGQGSWSVTDLDSTNGTFVNGTPVQGSRVLGDGDCITIGANSIRLLAPRLQTPVEAPLQEKIIIPEPLEAVAATPAPENVEQSDLAPVTVEFPFAPSPPVTGEGEVRAAAPKTAEILTPIVSSPAPATQELAANTMPFDARVLPVGTPPAPVAAPAQRGGKAGPYDSLFLLWHVLTYGVAILMALSLFLPWLNFNFFWVQGAYSYAQGLAQLLQIDSKMLMDGIVQEPRILFALLPLGTTLAVLSAAGYALVPVKNRILMQSFNLLGGGACGTLASLWFYGELGKANNQMMVFVPFNLNGLVGMGIPLYALTSFAALALGMMGLALTSRSAK